ncbi:MAG TPA: hypothetical protein VK611_09885 [Acidimicrobiales bacterium]|nr:hypothetical protein [Acidimicrobiales bacterium]
MSGTTGTRHVVEHEDQDELEAELHRLGWTDGLPVRVPTLDRVDRFVRDSGLDPDEVVGHVAPQGGLADVRLVAVNAVMAGCRPEHLPVVVATVKAIIQDPFNLYLVQVTTNPLAPLAVVNGPVRHELGLRHGRDALGPGTGGNGPIGRAVRFVMRNVGGIGDNDTSTHGGPWKYTFCIAEDEESSPWEPLHVWQGYDPDDSVVTTLGIEGIIDVVPESGTTTPANLMNHLVHAMQTVSTGFWWSRGNPTFVLTPGYAQLLHRAGRSRLSVQEELFERSKVPVSHLPFDNINTGEWKMDGDRILVTERPEDIYLIVAGASEGHHALYMLPCCLCFATHAKVPDPRS